MRMTPAQFDMILSKIEPDLRKQDTIFRKALEPGLKLALTLHFLASGDSQMSLSFAYRVSPASVSLLIDATLKAIWSHFKEDYLPQPSKDQWMEIAENYRMIWNFPNCIGALDGKHISIQCPPRSGSQFYNYKNFHSIVLMALCDANYLFIMIDVCSYGRDCDSAVFHRTVLSSMLKSPVECLPPSSPIVDQGEPMPLTLVADEAFPLMKHLMRPFPGKHCDSEEKSFNYRLFRARRTVENTFGILASRWRFFRKPVIASPEKAERIVCATCVLHNFLRKSERGWEERKYCPTSLADHIDSVSQDVVTGTWRQNDASAFADVGRQSANRSSSEARSVRNAFKMCFTTEGQLPWQSAYVNRICWVGGQHFTSWLTGIFGKKNISYQRNSTTDVVYERIVYIFVIHSGVCFCTCI